MIDFSVGWCGPCKMMAPILDQVKQMLGDRATILKVDVDKNPAAATAYHIKGVPTLILFKDGQTRWRQSGIVQANHLKQVIERYV